MQFQGLLFFIIMICVGYFSIKSKLVPEEATDVLPSILLHVCFPAMLFCTFSTTGKEELLSAGLPTVIVSLVFSLVPFLISFPLFRSFSDARRPLLRFISSIGNTSFACVPLLSLFLTNSQMSVVLVHGAVMDFLIWGVHQQIFIGSSTADKRLLLKKALTPNLFALIFGVICSAFSLQTPQFLSYTLEALAAAVSPLSLIFIGMLICRYGLLGWIHSKIAIVYSLLRVILFPCLVFGILYFLLPLDTAVILAICFGSPSPVSAVLWCKQYGKDTKLAVDCLIPSTILYFAVMGGLLIFLSGLGIFS